MEWKWEKTYFCKKITKNKMLHLTGIHYYRLILFFFFVSRFQSIFFFLPSILENLSTLFFRWKIPFLCLFYCCLIQFWTLIIFYFVCVSFAQNLNSCDQWFGSFGAVSILETDIGAQKKNNVCENERANSNKTKIVKCEGNV